MPTFIKMGIGTQGLRGHPGSHSRAAERFAGRRRVKEGFPWDGQFQSREEIERYFDDDRIACLLCGRRFRKLGGQHLEHIHGISDDEYKRRFGIPHSYSLVSRDSSEAYRHATVNRAGYKEHIARLEKQCRTTRGMRGKSMPDQPLWLQRERTVQVQARLAANPLRPPMGPREPTTWRSEHYEEFLRRMETGRLPREVAADEDMPGMTVWRIHRERNEDYDRRVREAWEALPFPVQARGEKMGERFRTECRRLFDLGYQDWRAAQELGVSTMTVNRVTRHFRRAK